MVVVKAYSDRPGPWYVVDGVLRLVHGEDKRERIIGLDGERDEVMVWLDRNLPRWTYEAAVASRGELPVCG